MNTRDLQYFTAVVETKNYTQVAGQFGVTQPTVTQAIQRLEREFDVQLVDVARHPCWSVTLPSGGPDQSPVSLGAKVN